GTDDLLTATPWWSDYTTFSYSVGGIWLVNGPTTGSMTVASADATLHGSTSYEYLGLSMATGDVNGDGMDDLVASGYYNNKVWLFEGPLSSTTTSSAAAPLPTQTCGQYADTIALPNLDGDSYMDPAIGEPYDYSTSDY